jgi:HEAT repeat protein
VQDLESKDSDLRRQAAKQLGELGPDARTAFSALVKALKDEDVYVRRFAALALGTIGGEERSTVDALSAALKDSNKRVITAAVESLGKIGPAGVTPLIEVLQAKSLDPGLKVQVVQSMRRAGKGAKEAVPALIDIAKTATRGNDAMLLTLRTEAVNTLGGIGPDAKEAVPVLEEIAGDKMVRDRGLKMAVQQALRNIKK